MLVGVLSELWSGVRGLGCVNIRERDHVPECMCAFILYVCKESSGKKRDGQSFN